MNNFSSIIHNIITTNSSSVVNVSSTGYNIITYRTDSDINISSTVHTMILSNPSSPAMLPFAYAYIIE